MGIWALARGEAREQRRHRMYHIFYCWDGRKGKVAFQDDFEDEEEWEFGKDSHPYDIIDEDDHSQWVDYGDE